MSDASTPLRLGIIGCGIISRTHAQASLRSPDAVITAASSRRPSALAAIADEFGIPNQFNDWREVVSCDDVDAVLICLPDGLHEEVTLEAVRCGKHVLVEKPMGNNLAQCEAMASAAEKAGIVLMVAHVIRQLPSHQLAKRMLQEGRIGTVTKATRRRLAPEEGLQSQLQQRPWMTDPQLCTDPLLFAIGSHEFDAMLWLFESEAQIVSAKGERIEERWPGWMAIEGSVGLRNGVEVDVSVSAKADEMTWDTVIQGSSGSITLLADRVIVDGHETECPCSPDDAFVAQLNEFVDCVCERREPGPSGRNVLATMAVLDAVLESMRDARPVGLPQLGVQW